MQVSAPRSSTCISTGCLQAECAASAITIPRRITSISSNAARLTLEGETYVIRENDVIYIPAGMVHSLANHGEDVFEIFEIYAPAGRQFDVVLDE